MKLHAVTSQFSIDRIVPYFQPIMDLKTNRVWRYECLARLMTENERIYPPSEFLTIVESKNWGLGLTQHIYHESHRYCYHRKLPWSINLSFEDLNNDVLIDWLIAECAKLKDDLFGIEISFQSAIEHQDNLVKLSKACPYLAISIDKVDMAHAALIDLLRINIKAIKLDGELVKHCVSSIKDKARLLEIKGVCDKMNTRLVAEHIEDEIICNAVKALDLQYGQGFYLSSPSARVQ